jgi:membrane dipeptidase
VRATRISAAGWNELRRRAYQEHDSNCTPPPITTVQDPRRPPAYTGDEHIDHAVKTVGVDHVGLGSAFDGAKMPPGMEDASKLPKIADALPKKGYSEADIEKILGGNILRVMEAVERCCATWK